MRARRLAVAATAVALAAAAALIGWSDVAATRSQETNVRLRLSEVRASDRSIQVVRHLPVGAGAPVPSSPAVESALRAFAPFTEPPRTVALAQAVGSIDARIVAVGERFRDVVVARGRTPHACLSDVCEALVLAGTARVGDEVALSPGVRLRVVGEGALTDRALPTGSEALRATPELTSIAFLVQSLDAPALAPLVAETNVSVVVTAALAPESVSRASVRAVSERIRRELVMVERSGTLVETTAPYALLDDIADRGDVARERLLLVAGQGAALIVAFAAFAAAARRRDVEALEHQLVTLGATGAQVAITRAVEAAVPTLLGAFAGAALTAAVGRNPAARTLLVIALVALVATGILYASAARPRRARSGLGVLELAALVAFATLVWQAATTGALDPDAVEPGPVLLVLPALAFLATGVVLLRVLPLTLRLAERLARGGPFGLRLAFLTAARSPAEAAAATTFLAVALGASVFALGYRATLEKQSRDEALFAAGAAWRVTEGLPGGTTRARSNARPSVGDVVPETAAEGERATGASDVTPLTRYARVSRERPSPVLRLDTVLEERTAAGRQVDVEVLALPATKIPSVLGWREDFSDASREEIAARLRPRPVRLAGPRVERGVDAIRFWARSDASLKRFVVFHLLRPSDQTFLHVRGPLLTRTWRPLELAVPHGLAGAELVGVEFPALFVPLSAPPDEGAVQFGRFEQHRDGTWSPLATPHGWVASEAGGEVDTFELPSGPVARLAQFNLEGSAFALVHPRLALPRALPALVSPRVAAAAVDGVVTVRVRGHAVLLAVADTADLFPSVVESPDAFAVVDYDALFARLNAAQPGVAPPSEAWFFGPQRSDFVERIGRSPFRVDRVVAAEPLAERFVSDPLGAGAREVLLLAAIAAAVLGLAGLILAARSTLAADRQVLAEYEALGVRPSTLERTAQLRLLALSLLGVGAGIAGGLLSAGLIGALVAVTGAGGRPLPPIDTVVAWRADVVVIGATAIAASLGAALLAKRAFRETAARRLRA